LITSCFNNMACNICSVLLPMLVLASGTSTNESFGEFQRLFNRTYATDSERDLRRKAFDVNMARAARLHKLNPSATYGARSPFADRTADELSALSPAWLVDAAHHQPMNITRGFGAGGPPSSFDAQQHGAVTEIKDQSEPNSGCNSCWAFVVATLLETGVVWQHSSRLANLSPQELIDCDRSDGGCSGGNMGKAFDWMEMMSYGLESFDAYPYQAKQGPQCLAQRKDMIVYPDRHYRLNYGQMVEACYQFGALGVGVNAHPIMMYTGGIIDFKTSDCDPRVQTHAVTIMGYGMQGSMPFWRFKNTWGTYWGEGGFARVLRGSNTCGIETFVVGVQVRAPKSNIIVV